MTLFCNFLDYSHVVCLYQKSVRVLYRTCLQSSATGFLMPDQRHFPSFYSYSLTFTDFFWNILSWLSLMSSFPVYFSTNIPRLAMNADILIDLIKLCLKRLLPYNILCLKRVFPYNILCLKRLLPYNIVLKESVPL